MSSPSTTTDFSSTLLATVKEVPLTSYSTTVTPSTSSFLNISDIPESSTEILNGDEGSNNETLYNHDLSMTITMTVIYMLITITGVVGNTATCIVIVRNRIMHTATNYYLFSMAISDLLLLAFGMPEEIYHLWWGSPYIFGAEFCFIRGFTAEISTNASILTIAAFTVERYIGICHPLRSHTMSQLGRVIRSIAVIWAVATACAIPIAIQYGIVYSPTTSGEDNPSTATCMIKKPLNWVFDISSVLFFVAPMLLITVLYACIAIQLQKSARIARTVPSIASHNCSSTNDGSRNKAVIKMLVAVVIAFFVCFAPHQAQRLMAIHADRNSIVVQKLFNVLYNISGISYYISTCVNPILYHIMSNRFRQALQVTLESCCGRNSGAGGGFQDSDAIFLENYKNGTSSYFHHYSQSLKHQRSLSVHQPSTLAAQRLRHTNSLTSRQVNNIQRRDFKPMLHQQSFQSSGKTVEESVKSNGTSHTWV
ncbi:pyrokinin-1 receptor-like isoform X1 [Palaemon carinicauda]|uniref:pyrokinin-1 receptor-like isoform X1 n=1 Tax=Palaemon carinicauda TaxID=392227 RepID=UPI0035B628A5